MCLMSAASKTGYRGGGGQTDIGKQGNGEICKSGGELYILFDWEPVKADEIGSDVLPGLGAVEDPGSRVLHTLSRVLEGSLDRTPLQ